MARNGPSSDSSSIRLSGKGGYLSVARFFCVTRDLEEGSGDAAERGDQGRSISPDGGPGGPLLAREEALYKKGYIRIIFDQNKSSLTGGFGVPLSRARSVATEGDF